MYFKINFVSTKKNKLVSRTAIILIKLTLETKSTTSKLLYTLIFFHSYNNLIKYITLCVLFFKALISH